MNIHTWRPVQSEMRDFFLGITPEFNNKSVVWSSEEKFSLEVKSSGDIIVEMDILLKDFELHGIE